MGYRRARRGSRRGMKVLNSEIGFDIGKQVMSYSEKLLSTSNLVDDDFLLEFIEATLSVKSYAKWNDFLQEQFNDQEKEKIDRDKNWYRGNDFSLFELLDDDVLKVNKEEALDYLHGIIKDDLAGYKSKSDFNADLLRLQEAFGLDNDSLEILIFLFCKEQYDPLDEMFSRINLGDTVALISKLTGITINKVSSVIDGRGDMVMSGLVENDSHRNHRSSLEISPAISEYFFGLSDDFFDGRFIVPDEKSSFALDSFHQNRKNNDTMNSLLHDTFPSSLLLYGIPGTGKTEYARTVASLSDKKVFFLKYEENDFRGRLNYQLALQVASKLVSMQDGILIIDEAETLFGNSSPFASLFGMKPGGDKKVKSWVNNFIDNLSCSTIWILNSVSSVHESTMRRFNYSVKFNDFDNQQRIALWHECCKTFSLKDQLSDDLIEKLSYEFPVNAGGINMSLEGTEKILAGQDYSDELLELTLRNFLEKQLILSGRNRGNPLKRITENYDLSAINLDTDIDELLTSLDSFSKFLDEGDQFARRSFKMLFWGRPGTGKTEFAKYIAQKTNRELIVKRASDLFSMWVGGTEKQIAAAFRHAEEKNAILFIDEIDTFLASRENAHRSFEVNQVNEFLTQLENFRGIFIGCSNLLKKLDFASLRRFDWKIEFQELTTKGRAVLFEKFFKQELSEGQAKELAAIKGLVPGDFNVVNQKNYYSDKDVLDADKLLQELTKEAKYREGEEKVVGF